MNIFQINEELATYYEMLANGELLDLETGEIVDSDLVNKIDELEKQLEDRTEFFALLVKEATAQAELIKQEKKKLEARQKQKENTAAYVKQILKTVLKGEKFETPKVAITYRTSEKVNTITDKLDIKQLEDLDLLRYKEPELNKTEIKRMLKQGITLSGLSLLKEQNIIIK